MEFRKGRSKTHSLGLSGQVKRKILSTITADTTEILSGKVGRATTGSTSADILAVNETSTSNSSIDVCCVSNDASGGASGGTLDKTTSGALDDTSGGTLEYDYIYTTDIQGVNITIYTPLVYRG